MEVVYWETDEDDERATITEPLGVTFNSANIMPALEDLLLPAETDGDQ